MLGRENIEFIECREENGFIPKIPDKKLDIIYLCSPNNPTGVTMSKHDLEKWVNYARENEAIILFDSVYEVFIKDKDIPHSIYEIEGAKEVAIEFRSYSKLAGFTGVRCSFMVLPKELKIECNSRKIELNELWRKRQNTKFGATSYIAQKGAEAVYSEEGQKEIKENIDYYLKNAKYMRENLSKAGFTVYGGESSPYILLKSPKNEKSWDFFDALLEKGNVITTPRFRVWR